VEAAESLVAVRDPILPAVLSSVLLLLVLGASSDLVW